MNRLEEFWSSPENQKKYGFTYIKEPYGSNKIIYGGDVDFLLENAYKAAGWEEMDEADNDPRPKLELGIMDSALVIKGSGQPVTTTVDGVGDEPNFALDFTYEGTPMQIRFSLKNPSFYPADYECPFFLPLSSLSALNVMMRDNYWELVDRWNHLRFMDLPALPGFYPNYRAINSIKE